MHMLLSFASKTFSFQGWIQDFPKGGGGGGGGLTVVVAHGCGSGKGSLDPRPSDFCILMEGLVRDDHVG